MIEAVAYLRVSGKSQVDGDGPERQEAAIRAYATQNGIQVVRVFFDAGVSGTKDSLDRPGWLEMLNFLDNPTSPRLILVERLDRLARDIVVQEVAIQYVRKCGYKVHSVQEPDLCEDDPSRKLVRVIMGAVAGYERDVLVLKLKAAKARKRARGERTDGAHPYGQHPLRPQEAQILQEIHLLKQKGLCDAHITRELNARSIPTRSGKPWQQMTVRTILRRAA